jgi:MFS family permease
MSMVASTTDGLPGAGFTDSSQRRLAIVFINLAHALDHFVILIYPTVIIELERTYDRSYSELILLGAASFTAFGLFSLPAGWLADRWSRNRMMVAFYIGSGISLLGAAFAPSLATLAVALFALGVFAAIYHPVGTALVLESATRRSRTLAFNAVCGNLGVALASGITAALTAAFSWRGAFLVPGLICLATGAAYCRFVADGTPHAAPRNCSPDVALPKRVAATIFALFVLIALSAGLVVNTMILALPKIVDERIGSNISLVAVGGLTTGLVLCGAFAQIAFGRLAERIRPHILFAVIAAIQFVGILLAAYARGPLLLLALAFTMAAVFGQITVNDLVIARYTADSWRGRAYAVRYLLTFMVSRRVGVNHCALACAWWLRPRSRCNSDRGVWLSYRSHSGRVYCAPSRGDAYRGRRGKLHK